jgi:MoxR-like ATPase
VTVSRRTVRLPEPFIVLATQNPIEQEGTYPLPEAQVDRFLLKLLVGYPGEQEYHEILERTTGAQVPEARRVTDGARIVALRRIVRQVPVPEAVRTYAVRLVMATQPGSDYAPEAVARYLSLGSSPRGAQALLLAAKYRALEQGRFAAAVEDIQAVALPVLRHRVLLNFRGQSERKTPDELVAEVLRAVPTSSGR